MSEFLRRRLRMAWAFTRAFPDFTAAPGITGVRKTRRSFRNFLSGRHWHQAALDNAKPDLTTARIERCMEMGRALGLPQAGFACWNTRGSGRNGQFAW